MQSATSRVSPALALSLSLLTVGAASGCRGSHKANAEPTPADPHTAAAAEPADPPAPVAGHPRLVVLVVIDQLPAWAFEKELPKLTGGLARLAREGVHYTHGTLTWSNTFTAAGHTALGTGAPPSVSSIVGNDWYRATGDNSVAATADPESPELAIAPGFVPPPGSGDSPRQLKVNAVADMLERATKGAAHTVGISLKARAAILPMGHHPDLAVWYDPDQAAFVTSRYYAAEPPAWLVQLSKDKPVSRLFKQVWRPSDPALVAQLSGSPDKRPGEGGTHGGMGDSFPHSLATSTEPAEDILYTPMSTDALFDAAEAATLGEHLGTDEVPDLLEVSISSNDYAGHAWGQESWERIDLVIRLDQRLGQFFDFLDQKVGHGNYAVVLSSDHGGIRIPEMAAKDGAPVHRVGKKALSQATEKAAEKVLGAGPWVRGLTADMIYVSPRFATQPAGAQTKALAAMASAARKVPGVAAALPTAALIGQDCDTLPAPRQQRICRSLAPDASGALYIDVTPGSLLTDMPTGSGHGSGSEPERTVPILVMAPGLAPRKVDDPVPLLAVAPTLSHLLGVPPPPAATARPLE